MLNSRALMLTLSLLLVPLCAHAEPVKSVDGELQLALPDGWEASTPHSAETEIAAMHRASHSNVIILSTPSADFSGTLKSVAQNSVRATNGVLVDGSSTDAAPMKINGHDALQYEIHGTLPKAGLKIAYLVTFVKLDKHLVQVSGWTTESRFSKDRHELEKLAAAVSEAN